MKMDDHHIHIRDEITGQHQFFMLRSWAAMDLWRELREFQYVDDVQVEGYPRINPIFCGGVYIWHYKRPYNPLRYC